MKLIEAMKKIKELRIKIDDLKEKVGKNCADLDFETPLYPEPRKQVKEWLQSIHDLVEEVLKLRIAVQRTNLLTDVTIEIGGKAVTKTIAEWIHRRKDLAALELSSWQVLGDRGLKEQRIQMSSTGGPPHDAKIRRYFDPLERDQKVEEYRNEPALIDRTLEVVNALTEIK